jgi:hypothetical protein
MYNESSMNADMSRSSESYAARNLTRFRVVESHHLLIDSMGQEMKTGGTGLDGPWRLWR